MGEAGIAPLTAEDYEAIEAAVQETARGRWFLAEFARRNRQADTLQLLDAIGRLDETMRESLGRAPIGPDAAPLDLAQFVERGHETKAAVPAGPPPTPGPDGLDLIADHALRVNGDIVKAVEHIQEIAWMLRETGTDGRICAELDRQASEIYAACSSQEASIARIREVVEALRSIERQVAHGLIDAAPAANPERDEAAMIEDDPRPAERRPALVLDDDIVSIESPYEESEATARPDDAVSSFAAIDRMSLHDKLSRFV